MENEDGPVQLETTDLAKQSFEQDNVREQLVWKPEWALNHRVCEITPHN